MAATDQTYRSQRTLDVVFAASCVLMLLSTVWMLWDDYNRPWKAEQRRFRDVETARNQRLMLEQLPDPEEVTVRTEEVKLAQALLKPVRDQIGPRERELNARHETADTK